LAEAVGFLKNLQILSLSNNKLTGELPSSLQSLTKIKTLYAYLLCFPVNDL